MERCDSTSSYGALVEALVLAVTAPTEEQSARAVTLGERIAAGKPEMDVARAKQAAEAALADCQQ